MDEDDPTSEYASIAAQYSEAKALKRRNDALQQQAKVDSVEEFNQRKELEFKASHGLLLVFFAWIL